MPKISDEQREENRIFNKRRNARLVTAEEDNCKDANIKALIKKRDDTQAELKAIRQKQTTAQQKATDASKALTEALLAFVPEKYHTAK